MKNKRGKTRKRQTKHKETSHKVYQSSLRSLSQQSSPRHHGKSWAVTWGSSNYQGLGRRTTYAYEPHPTRVSTPTMKGKRYDQYVHRDDIPVLLAEEDYAPVKQVAAGWTSSFAITTEGRVFEWGFHNKVRTMLQHAQVSKAVPIVARVLKRTGLSPFRAGKEQPKHVPLFGAETTQQLHAEAAHTKAEIPPWMTHERMYPIKVATNSEHRGVLTAGGHLFTWSESGDSHGVLGHGSKWKNIQTPQMLPFPDVIDFDFGFNHLSFITKSGTVYSSGVPISGSTGIPFAYIGEPKHHQTTRPVSVHTNYALFVRDLLDNVDKSDTLSTTSDTSYVIQAGRKGNLEERARLIRGLPLDQLSSKEQTTQYMTHMRVEGQQLITAITKASSMRGVESSQGAINPLHLYKKGRLPLVLPKMKQVSCGLAHTVLLDEHGKLWSYGKNSHGELGHVLDNNDTEETLGNVDTYRGVNAGITPVDFRVYYFPTQVDVLGNTKFVKVSCGMHHSVALSEDGEVYSFGSNQYGQCGRLNELPSTLRASHLRAKRPWSLPPGRLHISKRSLRSAKIIDIKAGFYDTAMILSDGRTLFVGSHLTNESKGRNVHSMGEFEPYTTPSPGKPSLFKSSMSLIQSLFSLELVPPRVHNYLQKYGPDLDFNDPSLSHLVAERYHMHGIAFGLGHAVAVATPRVKSDAVKQAEAAYAQRQLDGGDDDEYSDDGDYSDGSHESSTELEGHIARESMEPDTTTPRLQGDLKDYHKSFEFIPAPHDVLIEGQDVDEIMLDMTGEHLAARQQQRQRIHSTESNSSGGDASVAGSAPRAHNSKPPAGAEKM